MLVFHYTIQNILNGNSNCDEFKKIGEQSREKFIKFKEKTQNYSQYAL